MPRRLGYLQDEKVSHDDSEADAANRDVSGKVVGVPLLEHPLRD